MSVFDCTNMATIMLGCCGFFTNVFSSNMPFEVSFMFVAQTMQEEMQQFNKYSCKQQYGVKPESLWAGCSSQYTFTILGKRGFKVRMSTLTHQLAC